MGQINSRNISKKGKNIKGKKKKNRLRKILRIGILILLVFIIV